jgi:predicted RNA-binding Zn ribbon-like protein
VNPKSNLRLEGNLRAGLPEPIRIGDHLALDFLNTVASPKGVRIEWIADGRSLLDWMVNAEILDQTTLKKILATCKKSDLDATAREALELREWFRRLIQSSGHRARLILDADGANRLNRFLARDAAYQRVEVTDDSSVKVVSHRHWTQAVQLLVPIAGAIADLLCEGDLSLVRQCEDSSCTLLFYDRTKGHRRRWCSQSVCGNRAKVAAFRERARRSL